MKKVIYVEVSQADKGGRMHNTHVCDSREEAQAILKAVSDRYKELSKMDIAEKEIDIEEEEDAFYAYHHSYFNNFRAMIFEEDKKDIDTIIKELEKDAFFA